MFPKSEKIPLSVELYSLEAEKKILNFEYEILKTIYKVKDISYRYYFVEEKIKIVEKIINLLEEIEKINISKLKVAKAYEKDILRIQIEKEQMRNMLSDMIDSKNYILREFASILGIPLGEKLPKPPKNLKFTDENFSETEIWEIVKKKNPKLSIMEKEIRQAEIFIKLAYREYYPEIEAGIMRNFFSSMIITKPLITLSIPWREKVKYQIYSAESALKMKKAEYSSELLELATILSETLFRYRQANREKNLYEKILLPKAESVFYLTKSNYITGLSDIDEFLISEKNYYEFNINYLSAKILREITINEILLTIAGIMPENIWR
ncbi:MAG: TolC family protein [Candidatus Ratteibacteria bacterium]